LIHVLDELAVPPGRLAEVQHLVRSSYEPVATAAGMTLVHTWITPAVELHDEPTALLLLWEIGDTSDFWQVRAAGARDPRLADVWGELDLILEGRARRVMVDPDDRSILR
jgi:hypothetical protein